MLQMKVVNPEIRINPEVSHPCLYVVNRENKTAEQGIPQSQNHLGKKQKKQKKNFGVGCEKL